MGTALKSAVAKALGTKIYCDPRKRGILLCQTDPELHSLISSDPIEVSCGTSEWNLRAILIYRAKYISFLCKRYSKTSYNHIWLVFIRILIVF